MPNVVVVDDDAKVYNLMTMLLLGKTPWYPLLIRVEYRARTSSAKTMADTDERPSVCGNDDDYGGHRSEKTSGDMSHT